MARKGNFKKKWKTVRRTGRRKRRENWREEGRIKSTQSCLILLLKYKPHKLFSFPDVYDLTGNLTWLVSLQILFYSHISGWFILLSQIISVCYSFISLSLFLFSLCFSTGYIFPSELRLNSVISIRSNSFPSPPFLPSLILTLSVPLCPLHVALGMNITATKYLQSRLFAKMWGGSCACFGSVLLVFLRI